MHGHLCESATKTPTTHRVTFPCRIAGQCTIEYRATRVKNQSTELSNISWVDEFNRVALIVMLIANQYQLNCYAIRYLVCNATAG